jgi:hypothetical protein
VGSRVPVVVVAHRLDGFDGPIRVEVGDLPAGVSGNPAIIPAGQAAITLLLQASADAKPNQFTPFAVKTSGTIDGEAVVRWASAEDDLKLVSVIPPADLTVTTPTKEVVLEPGGTARITVNVRRNNGFAGQVRVYAFNLPKHIDLPESGLNGVVVDEDQEERSFTIRALRTAKPMETEVLVVGQVETRSPSQNLFAGEPIVLRVVAAKSD